MDRSIYTTMTGAKALMQRQEAVAHNLANVSTNGFRADLMAFRAVPVREEGTATTRVANLEASSGFDNSPGPIMTTGRPMDAAIRGDGWFAVQAADGTEGYTRNGGFVLSADGTLQTAGGLNVLGDGGPIAVPPGTSVSIGVDGTVSGKTGNQPSTALGKLKLVNPPVADLTKGSDGLMRTRNGDAAPDDPLVRVADGALEASNVNAVDAMVGMIALSRQFEVQMKMLQTTESNEQKAAQLLTLKS